MSLKIYLLRHGETEYSQRGAYCGALDAGLTAEGHQMAQAFAEAYRSIPWTNVYVSPMKRAIATAQPLCDAVALPMQIRDGLREIGYGAWEDRELDYVRQHYEQDYIRWQTDPAWNPPTDGETAIQIAARALPVITEIESGHKDGNVLVVSHKATIRIILCSLLAATGIALTPSLPPFASSSLVFMGRCWRYWATAVICPSTCANARGLDDQAFNQFCVLRCRVTAHADADLIPSHE